MDMCLIAQSFSWFSLSSWWAIAQVVIGLGFVIFVHELGHFLVAKACGVKCEKFYVGFDAFDLKLFGRVILPRALWKMQWGETEYGIGIVPLGGYVKMLGQDDNPANFEAEQQRARAEREAANRARDAEPSPTATTAVDPLNRTQYDPRSYLAKSVPQRMAIISADTPEALHRNLAALCGPLVLNLPERNEKEQALQVEAALRWLKLKRSDGIASAASAGAMHLDRSRFGKVNATCRSPPFTSNYS